ncbi:MAG: hypothetical protein QXL19_10315 [Ignisphaera sp.]
MFLISNRKNEKIKRETYLRRINVVGNLYEKDDPLTIGGGIIITRFTPNLYKMIGGPMSVVALRQLLLMKTIGAKYMPKDDVSYSYSVMALGYEGWRDPRAKIEDLWNAQKWNAYGVVWVEYKLGLVIKDYATAKLYSLAEDFEKFKINIQGISDDINAIVESGPGIYFSYCDYIDKLSKVDNFLFFSTMKMLKSIVSVYREDDKREDGKVAVYTRDGDSIKIEEREGATKVTPIFDAYLAMPYILSDSSLDVKKWVEIKLSNSNYLNKILQEGKPTKKEYIDSVKDVLWSIWDKVLPGWITVAGVNAFYDNMENAVIRAIVDSARVLETIDNGKPVSGIAQAIASIGGLSNLSKHVLSKLDTVDGKTLSEEDVAELVKNYTKSEAVVEFIKTVSSVLELNINNKKFWEIVSRLDKPNENDVEILAKAFSKIARDEEIGEIFVAGYSIASDRVDVWTLASSLFSDERKSAIYPYLVLRIGEELIAQFTMSYLECERNRSIGIRLGNLYENCFGSQGAQLAKLYRGLGVVVPMLYINNSEKRDELIELLLNPSRKIREMLIYSSFYSFGVPISKMYRRYGYYEAFIPFALFLRYRGLEKPIELKLYRSRDGRIVEETALVGGLTDFFKAIDEVVLNYIEQVKKWGIPLDDPSVYQGLLYIFSSRRYDEEEKIDDMFPAIIDIVTGYARATARFIVELEKDLKKLDKLNAKVSKAIGKIDEEKLAKWVEKKYSKIHKELEIYRKSVEDLRKELLSIAQYLHPKYMEKLTEASKVAYEILIEFENLHDIDVRIQRAVDWLKQKSDSGNINKTWIEYLNILQNWYNTYVEEVLSLPSRTWIPIPIDINSTYSIINNIPIMLKLFSILEDAKRFREEVLPTLLAVEKEIELEEKMKEIQQSNQQTQHITQYSKTIHESTKEESKEDTIRIGVTKNRMKHDVSSS